MSQYNSTNKVSAYREIAANYDAARTLLYEKKLAYGESAVVPFYYPDKTATAKTIELMEGIGSLNGDIMVNCNILGSNVVADSAIISVPDSSVGDTLSNVIKDIYEKIDNHDSSVYNALVQINDTLNITLTRIAEAIEARN